MASSSADQALEDATVAFSAGRFAEAERLAAAVLRAQPGHRLAAHIVGVACLKQDRPRDAVAPLRTAADGAEDPVNETLLARALMGAGRAEEALAQLTATATRQPPYLPAFLELAEQLAAAGRVADAVEALERGLELAPDADGLRIALAYLHLRRNDRAAAREAFEHVRAVAPARADAIVGLARVLTLDGDYAAAAKLYGRALELQPDDPTLRIGLGKCLLELGQREAGEAALREAVAAAAPLGMAAKALAATPHGRLFLRSSALTAFLGAKP